MGEHDDPTVLHAPRSLVSFDVSEAMSWVLSCEMVFDVLEPAEIVFQSLASTWAGDVVEERIVGSIDARPLDPVAEIAGSHGTRMQVNQVDRGRFAWQYRAEVAGAAGAVGPAGHVVGGGLSGLATGPATEAYERQLYLRPSRYCPSDHLIGFAVAEFGLSKNVADRTAAIAQWIRERIGYVPGSSSVHDSAEDTLLRAVGTCRDFAHLGVALCRATGVPARFASVYAPGLSPMDFHAVFEALVDGRWYVYDATGLAPRPSVVRIATGRDAADAAFASVTSGIAVLEDLVVTATVSPGLPLDNHEGLAVLSGGATERRSG